MTSRIASACGAPTSRLRGEAGNKALTRYMRGKDVVDVTSREGADVMGDIRFSLGIAAGRDLTEEQSADLVTVARLL